MRVAEAKGIASAWVLREATGLPGFQGAYFAGSVNWLPDDAVLPAASDLDVNVVFDGPDAQAGRRKLVEGGVLLEISNIPLGLLRTPEQVLADFALAGGFRVPSVIADPTGHLTSLQSEVARRFAEPAWVRRRCEHARSRGLEYLDGCLETRPFSEQIIGWTFGTSVMALLPLVAGLRNPTVRRRYVAAREILVEHGRLDLYESFLGLLGCAAIRPEQVESHLEALTSVFDAAVRARASAYPFSADISPLSRHIAIDGSHDLIANGLHREAVFWLLVTGARSLTIFEKDAPDLSPHCEGRLRALLSDLGIASVEDLQTSVARTRALLPEIEAVSEQIIAANGQPLR